MWDKIQKILISLIFLIFASCFSETREVVTIGKITSTSTQFSVEDLISIGFKKNKTYKIDELPKAVSAYYGFVKFNEPARDGKTKKVIEYELRFYNSHRDAIQFGTDYAEERVGSNAKLKKTHNPRWKEGLKDARLCIGDQFNTWKNSADCGQPKFNEFYVYGNLIVLCEGRTIDQATENCEIITSRLKLSKR